MRHLSALAATVIAVIVLVVTPSASAQEVTTEACSISPSSATIGPGEVAEFTYTFIPAGSEAISIVTFDGEEVSDGFSFAEEEVSTGFLAYDDLVAEFSEALGRPVTEGVIGFSFLTVVGEGDDEREEELCAYSVVLVGAPDPEPDTTTTTTPEPVPEPVGPRYTG